jgi:CheY-like chemotaxis protein
MTLARAGLAAPTPPPLAGRHVLVVDDDADTLELLAFVLRAAGADVRTAQSAAEARLGAHRSPPDLVITDLAMPLENGLCVLRDVVALRQTAGHPVRAMLLTAHADASTRQTAEGLGFDLVLVKPVDPITAVDEIAAALAR